jgi:hypothetical protein
VIKNAMSMMTDDEDAAILLSLVLEAPPHPAAKSEIKINGKRSAKIPSESTDARFI